MDKFSLCEKRVYGDYTLVKYTVNGVDSIQHMKNTFGLNFHFYYEDINGVDDLQIDGGNTSSVFVTRYNFVNHKKCIRMDAGSILFTVYGAPYTNYVDFVILKLSNDEIHMSINYNYKEYYIELS